MGCVCVGVCRRVCVICKLFFYNCDFLRERERERERERGVGGRRRRKS